MDNDEIIGQLKRENELLKVRIEELEAQLARYENPHTPPSMKRGGNSRRNQKKSGGEKPGQKKGHKGVTRQRAEPDRQVEVRMGRCPYCDAELGDPVSVESKIIEEIPEPQPVIVTEYKIAHYTCPGCHREVVASDPDCPKEGIFGNNTIAQATVLKYEERLPHRKIQNVLKRQYGLDISPATILDLTRRASDAVRSEYEEILDRIRGAEVLYVDETSIRVQGEKYWIWAFATPAETFVVIRKSRGMKVLMEILTRWFTFVLRSDVEPTNNRAERALREHVVQRKIIGTLRNEKGTSIHEKS